jgi:hypothetical protein
VNLKLRSLATNETVEMKDVPMTHEKRQAIWHARQAEEEKQRDAGKNQEKQ